MKDQEVEDNSWSLILDTLSKSFKNPGCSLNSFIKESWEYEVINYNPYRSIN